MANDKKIKVEVVPVKLSKRSEKFVENIETYENESHYWFSVPKEGDFEETSKGKSLVAGTVLANQLAGAEDKSMCFKLSVYLPNK